MATTKKGASGKEKTLAKKMVEMHFLARQKCVPLKCSISGGPCLYLVTCDPMTCGGLQCSPLKKA